MLELVPKTNKEAPMIPEVTVTGIEQRLNEIDMEIKQLQSDKRQGNMVINYDDKLAKLLAEMDVLSEQANRMETPAVNDSHQ
jgi:hypothetical protein